MMPKEHKKAALSLCRSICFAHPFYIHGEQKLYLATKYPDISELELCNTALHCVVPINVPAKTTRLRLSKKRNGASATKLVDDI